MIGRKFTRFIFSLLLLLAVIHDARADNGTGRQQGRALATQQRATISGMFDEMPDNTTVPGYIGTTLPEGGYDSDTLGAADNATLNERATQAKETVFSQPRWDIEDGQLDGALAVQADPGEFHGLGDFLSGEYEACDPTITMSGEPATEHFCDRWRPTEDSECTSTVGVTYGRDITYQCQRDTPDTYRKCDEYYEPAICELSTKAVELMRVARLDTRGVNAYNSTTGTLVDEWGYTAKFNADGNFQISGPGIGKGSRRTHRENYNLIFKLWVTVQELKKMTSFTLAHVGYDDGIQILVNGERVYSAGKKFREGEGGEYHTANPNIELIEHLQYEQNTIELIGYVVHVGRFNAIFTAEGCVEITGEWREVCEE